MVKFEGVYVWDFNGNWYLDGIGGLWCVNIGYGWVEIVEVIVDQVCQMVYYIVFGVIINVFVSNLVVKLV